MECSGVADQYLDKHHKEAAPYTGSNMVYFLHVPRTAGRTFHSCLLKLAVPPSRRCAKAYDHLRINVEVPDCYLLSSHDDFSVVSMLPDNVSVLSQIRDPVDRLLSAYEFAIEVASRAVNRPTNFKKRANKMATEDVWPWSYLVPWFMSEIRARLRIVNEKPTPESGYWIYVQHPDGSQFYYNKLLGLSKWNITEEERQQLLPELNPYDNPMLPSLKEFAESPVSHELLHNGASFQVLGITNYSHWGDAGQLRQCVMHHRPTADILLKIALKRIRNFVHVGTTDKLWDSAASAAAALDFSLTGPAFAGGDEMAGQASRRNKSPVNKVDTAQLAARITAISRGMRQTRSALQEAQKELLSATHDNLDEDSVVGPLRTKIAGLRGQLKRQQDELVLSRDSLGVADGRLADTTGRGLAELAGGGGGGIANGSGDLADENGDEHVALPPGVVITGGALFEPSAPSSRRLLMQSSSDDGGIVGGRGSEVRLPATAGGELSSAGTAGGTTSETGGKTAGGTSWSQQHEVSQAIRVVDEAAPRFNVDDEASRLEVDDVASRLHLEQLPPSDTEDSGSGRRLLEGQMRQKAAERHLAGNLGQEFVTCAHRAQTRNLQRKDSSLSQITMPDSRGLSFTKASRAAIPASVIEYIRSQNWLDVALHDQALEQLAAARTKQQADGTLKVLPPAPPPMATKKSGEFPIPKPLTDFSSEEL